jgi:hypothetical protein
VVQLILYVFFPLAALIISKNVSGEYVELALSSPQSYYGQLKQSDFLCFDEEEIRPLITLPSSECCVHLIRASMVTAVICSSFCFP